MRTKEHYYGSYQYETAGIAPFLGHVRDFLQGTRTVPVTQSPSTASENLFFSFSIDLFRLFMTDLEKVKKPYECALKYGFRGYSAGGRNGIFLIRRQDGSLIAAAESLIDKCRGEILDDLACDVSDLPALRKIKIVCHDPSGERMVGVLNGSNNRAIFLGFGRY